MEISEVRVKLVERSTERLRAFCSITLDGDFVIRDLKIIDGTNGAFVAMPSRKLADRCTRCGGKNHLRAKFCNDCGQRLNENRAPRDPQGRCKLHADVAHPINAGCRERIQNAVIKAFHEELERSKSPDYKPPKFDDFDDDIDHLVSEEPSGARAATPATPAAPAAAPAPAPVAKAGDESFGDYNSLIAELKREAAGRRDEHDEKRSIKLPGTSRGSRPDGGTPRPETRGEEPEASAPAERPVASRSPARRSAATPPPTEEFGSGL